MRRARSWFVIGVACTLLGIAGCATDMGCCHCPCPCSWFHKPAAPPEAAESACSGTSTSPAPAAENSAPPGKDESAFAQAPAAGTGAESLGNPNMMGDFLRGFVTQFGGLVFVPAKNIGPTGNSDGGISGSLGGKTGTFLVREVRVPEAGGGAFKIAENESPRPQDRVFLTYNYYDDIAPSINRTNGLPPLDLHVATLGFEKTLLDGDASLGLRVPVYQMEGPAAADEQRLGDLSVIGKYAWINDGPSGNVLSSGLMLTAPTAKSVTTVTGGRIHSTVFQPFVGYLVNVGADWYFHGFTSWAVPTDGNDVSFLFNDFGLGYWLYRNGDGAWLLGVAPTTEVHFNTPLDHHGFLREPIGAPDSIVLTEGVHFFVGRAVVQLGVAAPITGPRPFDIEAIAQLNYRF